MNHCSETVDIEDCMLGMLSPAREREVRAHLANCAECRREELVVAKERALFERREELIAPPALDVKLQERLHAAASEPPLGLARRLRIRGVAIMSAAAACGAMWALLHRGAPAASSGAATRFDDPLTLVSRSPVIVPSDLRCEPAEEPTMSTRGDTVDVCEDDVQRTEETSCASPSANDTSGE